MRNIFQTPPDELIKVTDESPQEMLFWDIVSVGLILLCIYGIALILI